MPRTFEGLSTWIFRIAAVSVLAFVVQHAMREQSRPAKVDLQDAKYLERMEDFINREHACTRAMAAKRRAYESAKHPLNVKPQR
jgi:hypothetical protein